MMINRSGGMYAARAVSCCAQWVRSARKTVQWTVFSGERAAAQDDEGRRRPSEPQSIERGSVLCDNGELRVTDTGCSYNRINHLAPAESLPCGVSSRESRRDDRKHRWGRRSPPRPVGDEGGWSRNEAQSA